MIHGESILTPLLRTLIALTAVLATAGDLRGQAAEPEGNEFFEKHVRPLLVERCQNCHGAKKQWAGLRLDSAAHLQKGGDSGPALVPGKPAESELILRVTHEDAELRMPPAEAGPPLTAEQIQILSRWIELGAPWPVATDASTASASEAQRDHWAFQPIKRPEIYPPLDPAQSVDPIDHLIVARLSPTGLHLSPAADRRTLIRRATYDLTGLPPSVEEVEAFVRDDAPDAYARLIDRLLASPRYGEQWGRHWLDIARYSDSKGYVYGREHRFFVHPALYRDWVIEAFNKDMPYDRFVLLQLAADQVAPEDPSALAAMGFLTLGRRFLGVTPDIIDDRIDVVSRGLMGLTVGCARCHDHKYDPIPTADYYSLYGVFQNCAERMVPLERDAATPPLTPALEAELQSRTKKLADTTTAKKAEAEQRIRQRIGRYLLAQFELDKYPNQLFNQLLGSEELIPITVEEWTAYLERARQSNDPIFLPWFAFSELSDQDLANEATTRLQELTERSNPRVAAAFATPPKSRAEVAERYQQLFTAIDQQWQQLCESEKLAGRAVPTALPDATDEALRQVLYGSGSPCVIPDEPIVNTESYWDYETVVALNTLQSELDQCILREPDSAPHAVVLNDRVHTIDPRIFRRGNASTPGESVPRQFLKVIAGEDRRPFSQGSGRLELARAIVDPKNPLTARVWVNRIWLQHFGRGLVSTPSDFGMRAETPSHPELLDWLASELIANGWSTKALHRQIMLSATYQQSSTGPPNTPEQQLAQQKDPGNRLLWRMNDRKLSFEQYRDTLAQLSSELNLTMGGRPRDLFAAEQGGFRRSVYGQIDRQFLPTVLRVFDFANPDLHTSLRAETTVPQQALFGLNHPFVADRSRAIVARLASQESRDNKERVRALYQTILQRDPTPTESAQALSFLDHSTAEVAVARKPPAASAWAYGYGEFDERSGALKSFTPLPHFSGNSWQGGAQWPDAALGWLQLTAEGGHPGNDLEHAIVRRWKAPFPGTIAVSSEFVHEPAVGDGVRYWIISSRLGILKSGTALKSRHRADVESIEVQPGDTIDFIVDRNGNLNSDQFLWAPQLKLLATNDAVAAGGASAWNTTDDFPARPLTELSPWEQLVQLLLISNEVMFID